MAITITVGIDTDAPIPTGDTRLTGVVSSVLEMNLIVPLLQMRFKRSAGPPDSHHDYVYSTVDGRQYFQDVQTIDTTNSYFMTMDVPAQWDQKEVIKPREIRSVLVDLDREFGIAQISITFS